jgi:trehalose 6-phosphate synthase/phosphatase
MKNIMDYSDQMVAAYTNAKSRIFFIDYDGTLARLQSSPTLALPTNEIKKLLVKLGSDDRNRIVILSGRERETLQSWLGNMPVTLAAEHGGFCKDQFGDWRNFFELPVDWMPRVFSSLRALTFNFSGSFIEQKSYSLVWHYRSIASTLKESDVIEISKAILSAQVDNEFVIYQEDCALEVRTAGVDKGRFATKYMQQKKYDFILAVGDGKTDEDLFEAVGKNGYTIKVGENTKSLAQFFIDKQDNVLAVLDQLTHTARNFDSNSFYEKIT